MENLLNDLPQSAQLPKWRRVLVIVRAGEGSLHPAWLKGGDPETRNWDLHISYYGDQEAPFPDRPSDVTLSFEKGTKATGTVACLNKLGERLSHYDWFWLPDDDLDADLPTLNNFFQIVKEYGLELAQPALGANSYISHEITVQRPHMKLRYTTFVEIMATCFSRTAFDLCRPYLDATISSWGPDILFPKLLGYPVNTIAIIDATPVTHTRPAGRGPNSALTFELGANPNIELADFLLQHDLIIRHETWSGIRTDNVPIRNLEEIDQCKVNHFR